MFCLLTGQTAAWILVIKSYLNEERNMFPLICFNPEGLSFL